MQARNPGGIGPGTAPKPGASCGPRACGRHRQPAKLAQVEDALAEIAAAMGARPGASEPPSLPGGLTGRQAQVLALLAAGLSNKQIAAELFLSTATVERHLATVYRKLGLTSRVDAARFAIEARLAATSDTARAL